MEKVLRISWSEVLKWLVLIVGIATTYGVMQTKIAQLERGREENKHNIEELSERMRSQEIYIAHIKEQTTQIQSDVTVIKNAILNSSLNPAHN